MNLNNTDWKSKLKLFWNEILSYFNLSQDVEPQEITEESIRAGISFKGSQLLILIFAIFVASLGLNTNSIAVIIGAMLISPLMGPIMGMGLGIGINDYDLVKRGFKNITMAVIGSILASALYFLISPQYEVSSQLLARTSPSIYDVFVALFGGAAGILSTSCKNKGQVLPGVAIATSLMPPLCTVGYGLATWQGQYFFGALYLFFTNMVFILVATWLGVKLMGFKPMVYKDPRVGKRVQLTVYTLVTLTIGVSCYLTVLMISKNIYINEATDFVNKEFVFKNTQVLNYNVYTAGNKHHIDVTLIGEALPKDSLKLAMLNKLDSCGLHGTILNIKQGFAESKTDNQQTVGELYPLMQNEINKRQVEIDSLNSLLAIRNGFSDEAVKIAPEIKVIFPSIKDIALSNMVLTNIQNGSNDTINMAFINVDRLLNNKDLAKLSEYISVRLNSKKVEICQNPQSFPWPSKKPAAVENPLPKQEQDSVK